MAQIDNKIFVGIDWGTHSSKTVCRTRVGYLPELPLFSSRVNREADGLTFSPNEEAIEEENKPLKELLIQDPLGQHFWNSDRLDVGTSLGEAVAFSLCCLLVDTIGRLPHGTEVELGFSFPNWLADPTKAAQAAASNFRDAVATAIGLYAAHPRGELPHASTRFSLVKWKQMVKVSRAKLGNSLDELPDFDVTNITTVPFRLGDFNWRFLFESGAAGLPYLRHMELEDVRDLPGFAKVLVVDVGAGSTDVGYMVHAQNPKTSGEKFYYFPPARSLPEAGNALTEGLRNHFRERGERMTSGEAEARKLGSVEWSDQRFARAWMRRIAEHVEEYVGGIDDQMWLVAEGRLSQRRLDWWIGLGSGAGGGCQGGCGSRPQGAKDSRANDKEDGHRAPQDSGTETGK